MLSNNKLRVIVVLALALSLGCLLLVHSAYSQSAASAHYRIISTDAAAKGYASSANYHLYSTTGQSGDDGVASGPDYQVQVGFVRRAFLDVPPPISVGGIAAAPNLPPPLGGDYPLGLLAMVASLFVAILAAIGGWRLTERNR